MTITDERKCNINKCYICRWSDKYKAVMASSNIEEIRDIAIEAIREMEGPVTDAVYWKCKYYGTWGKDCPAVVDVATQVRDV